jgi:hypothetical protein
MEFPKMVECGDPLASQHRGTYVELDSYVSASPVIRGEVKLLHRLPGYQIAGSAMRYDKEAWGYRYRQGASSHGRWFLSEGEARDAFAKLQRNYP